MLQLLALPQAESLALGGPRANLQQLGGVRAAASPLRAASTRLGASATGSSSATAPAKTRSAGAVLTRETLAGAVTALATIPTSVSYATVVGVSPLVGIWSSAIVGLFSAVVGREPGLISAAAGVIAIPMGLMFKAHGAAYVAATMVLAGFIEFMFGQLQLGTRMGLYCEDSCDVFTGSHINAPIIAGFMNAFFIFLIQKQMHLFHSFSPASLPSSLATAALTIAGINVFPKLTQAVPGSLLGLMFASVLSVGVLKLPLLLLTDYAGPGVFAGGLGALPKFTGASLLKTLIGGQTGAASFAQLLKIILPAAVGVATISILETAIAAEISGNNFVKAADEEDAANYVPHGNRAMKGLGVGNFISALLGGFGGCGVIPNTQLNARSGGVGLSSSIAYSLTLAASVVFAAPLIGQLPLAALGGLMIHVAFNTVEWHENKELFSQVRSKGLSSSKVLVDLATMLVTTFVCIKGDMGLGVLAGVAVSKLAPVVDFLKSRTALLFKKGESAAVVVRPQFEG